MKSFSPQQIQDAYEKLPKNMAEAIEISNIGDIVAELAKKHRLHIDTQEHVMYAINMVLIGLYESTDFKSVLKSSTGLDDTKLGALMTDINEEIFKLVRGVFKALQIKEAEDREAAFLAEKDTRADTLEKNYLSRKVAPAQQQTTPKKTPSMVSVLYPSRENQQTKTPTVAMPEIAKPKIKPQKPDQKPQTVLQQATRENQPSITTKKMNSSFSIAPTTTKHTTKDALKEYSQETPDPYQEPID